MNEELMAVKAELQRKIDELEKATSDISSKLVYDRLHLDCQTVLEKLIPVQKEVVATDRKWLNVIIEIWGK